MVYRALAITPIRSADAAPVIYELVGDSTEIGSADDNAIVLSDATVAPHHLAVRHAGGRDHLLVDVQERRRCRDLEWIKFKPGDVYWCPRHGSIARLDARGRCPRCKRRRGSLWLLRPLEPGDTFNIGKAFRAALVAQASTVKSAAVESRLVFPSSELFAAPPSRRIAAPRDELEIPIADLPTSDSNLWQWRPERAPFPIFLHQRVNRLITAHARENDQREVGGVLLGDVRQESSGQLFVVITHALKAEFANETRGHLTFTQKTWLKIHQAHQAQYPDKTIVGWYHTHPGWTIFLSDWDLFIHRNFFKQRWQIALVLDPSLDQAGFFVWNGNDVASPNAPVEPFRLIELDSWNEGARARVRIKLKDEG
ncbi:MAG: Mov34/MPN/PAD-1 family protein [Chloroflexi bacterium]|nr:Mov34/MPN/PAD-1 family protein [Chloroflexota bacterium]